MVTKILDQPGLGKVKEPVQVNCLPCSTETMIDPQFFNRVWNNFKLRLCLKRESRTELTIEQSSKKKE